MKTFYQYLKEAEMLDISITNADKVAKDESSIKKFLSNYYEISVKYDGVKLTLWRNNEDYSEDYRDNWVIAYKGNIIYSDEFESLDKEQVKQSSMGTSQYTFIHDHIKKIHNKTKKIPKNTEFFVEFIMNKLTLTRDYTKKHGLYLISHSKSTGEEIGGQLFTSPGVFDQSKQKEYAKILELNIPEIIFQGTLDSKNNFKKGIKSDTLLNSFNKFDLDYSNIKETYENIKEIFLNVQSNIGDKVEGVVLKDIKGKYFKFLQSDQHDKAKRAQKKEKFLQSKEEETQYWKDIYTQAEEILSSFSIKIDNLSFKNILANTSKIVYSLKETLAKNPKKSLINIQDDLFLTCKNKILNNLPENQNALFLGRLQPPTKAHLNMIEEALNKFNSVVLCLVQGKKTEQDKNPFPLELQKEIIYSVFGRDKVKIITHNSGNLSGIIRKSKWKIQYVLCGTDRVEGYKNQLKGQDITIVETKRTDEDISATKVRNAIKENDFNTFKKMMNPKTYKYFEELKKYL